MSIPLFASERSKPEITTRPLSVGCLVFERMDQIDFTGPFEIMIEVYWATGDLSQRQPYAEPLDLTQPDEVLLEKITGTP